MADRIEWQVREYRCRNGVCEKTKFPVYLDGFAREGTRQYARRVARAEKLSAESARELALLMNNNFQAGRDSYLTLDYSMDGLRRLARRIGVPENEIDSFLIEAVEKHDEENRRALYIAAEKEAENYMKRIRRACKGAGVDLRYAYVTSDLKGKDFEPVRVHHHLIVNAEAASMAEACWTAGGAKARVLFGPRGDLTELAAYMIGQVRQEPGKHRYHPSRNLERPEATKPVPAKNPDAPLRVPAGCEFIWRSESYAGRPQVLRYWRPPEKRRKRKEKRGKETRGGESA